MSKESSARFWFFMAALILLCILSPSLGIMFCILVFLYFVGQPDEPTNTP